MSENTLSRRALIEGAAIVTAAAGVPLAAAAASQASPDPVVALVDRFLPLYRVYKEASRAQDAAYAQHANAHEYLPVFEYGFGRYQTSVYRGDLSAIERYYDKCLDEAETPAQRAHLRQRRARQLKDAQAAWEDWDRYHREAGLYALEDARKAAEAALDEIEEAVLTAKPSTPEGVAAMIRLAMAYAWDHDSEPEYQPSEVRALRSALAFFGQEGGAA
jgi:hypothetical protein